jgi:hypothetical protein
MSDRFAVLAVAAIGWLVASLLAFAIVALVGFFGVGLIGLVFWFICTRVELQSEGDVSLFSVETKAKQDMSRAERASRRHERTLAVQSARFFRNLGIGLTLIGFGGFLYFQLGVVAT